MSSTPLHDQLQQNMRLFVAIQHNNEQQFVDALAAGGDPFARDSEGETLLHKAADNEFLGASLFRRVLELGIDPNSQSKVGETPLHMAVWKGHEYAVRGLLNAGANPNAQTEKGFTAYHTISAQSGERIPRWLQLAGGDAELPDNDHRTPQEWHASRGQGFMLDAYFDWQERQENLPDSLNPPSAQAVQTWDNPFCTPEVTLAAWKKLPEALQAAHAEDAPVPPAVLTRIAAAASRDFVLPQALAAMHDAGFRLQADAMLNPMGELAPELHSIVQNGDLPLLFTRENWKGGDTKALAEVLEAMPQEYRAEITNVNQLRLGMQQDAAAQRTRGR